ncbi:MAG: hypothetical protein U0359_19125 [Byssovorax sp.]
MSSPGAPPGKAGPPEPAAASSRLGLARALIAAPRAAARLRAIALAVGLCSLALLVATALRDDTRPPPPADTVEGEVPVLSTRALVSLTGATRLVPATEGTRRDTVGAIDVVQSCDRSACRVGVVDLGSQEPPLFVAWRAPFADSTMSVRWSRTADVGHLRASCVGAYRIERAEGHLRLVPGEEAPAHPGAPALQHPLAVGALGLAVTLGLLVASRRATRRAGT